MGDGKGSHESSGNVLSISSALAMTADSKGKGVNTGDAQQILRTCTREINELGKRGQWQQALQLFHSMQQQGMVPNVITYSALISALGKG